MKSGFPKVIKWICIIVSVYLWIFMAFMMFGIVKRHIDSFEEKSYSKWQSEDGRVVFYVGKDGTCYGTIETDGEKQTAFFTTMHPSGVRAYNETGEITEEWETTESKRNTFLCEVSSKTTAFHEGDLIRINLVEKNINPDEMPKIPKKPFFVYDQDPLAPNKLPLSMWQTEDGKVTVYVAKNGTCYGTIKTEKEEMEVFYHLAEKYNFYIYRADNGLIIEHWGKKEETENRLQCKVYESMVYEREEIATLNLIQKDLSEEELPPMPKEPAEVRYAESSKKEVIRDLIGIGLRYLFGDAFGF